MTTARIAGHTVRLTDGVLERKVAEQEGRLRSNYPTYAEMTEALRLCVVNAETAAKYADGTPKDTLKVQAAPHWPGITMARALLARIGGQ